jgi:hypothetical protein
MEAHQRLPVFLPKLYAALLHVGFPEKEADIVCDAISKGHPPGRIASASSYHRAWIVCDAMEDILTTVDDGSEAATWCMQLADRIFEYQDAFKAKHGYMPLDPSPIGQNTGPAGTA